MADVDQAPPGVDFPLNYEEWFAENGEAAGETKTAAPGTYTDGTRTIIIGEDSTFVMTTPGQNMEGQEFELTVTGEIGEDNEISITGVFDGDLDLTELASEEQIEENIEIATALFAIALLESAPEDGESESGLALQTEEYEITVGDVIALAQYEDLEADSEQRAFKITFDGEEYTGKIDKGVWKADDPSGAEVIAAYQAAHEADPNFMGAPAGGYEGGESAEGESAEGESVDDAAAVVEEIVYPEYDIEFTPYSSDEDYTVYRVKMIMQAGYQNYSEYEGGGVMTIHSGVGFMDPFGEGYYHAGIMYPESFSAPEATYVSDWMDANYGLEA